MKRLRVERPRRWFYAVRTPGNTLSSKAHLFIGSIAVCSVNYAAGLSAGERAEKCRNCLRMKDAEIFR